MRLGQEGPSQLVQCEHRAAVDQGRDYRGGGAPGRRGRRGGRGARPGRLRRRRWKCCRTPSTPPLNVLVVHLLLSLSQSSPIRVTVCCIVLGWGVRFVFLLGCGQFQVQFQVVVGAPQSFDTTSSSDVIHRPFLCKPVNRRCSYFYVLLLTYYTRFSCSFPCLKVQVEL